MPGAHGNELLSYAREFHPGIVRMLTTAYSELGEAIEAINSGEIYRYITKPWDLGSLHADLRNALELANLRSERDHLAREKLLVQQQQLLGNRLASLTRPSCRGTSGITPDFFRPKRSAALPLPATWRAGTPSLRAIARPSALWRSWRRR